MTGNVCECCYLHVCMCVFSHVNFSVYVQSEPSPGEGSNPVEEIMCGPDLPSDEEDCPRLP